MSRIRLLIALSVSAFACGCVTVDTPQTRVEVGPGAWFRGQSDDPAAQPTAYAKPLKRVSEQEAKVVKELDKRKWEKVVRESSEWVDYTRQLSAYADSSHDPALFRKQSQELLTAVQAVHQAALRSDAAACQNAINATDPILAKFMRTFPLTVPEAMAAARNAGRQDEPNRPAVNRARPQAP